MRYSNNITDHTPDRKGSILYLERFIPILFTFSRHTTSGSHSNRYCERAHSVAKWGFSDIFKEDFSVYRNSSLFPIWFSPVFDIFQIHFLLKTGLDSM